MIRNFRQMTGSATLVAGTAAALCFGSSANAALINFESGYVDNQPLVNASDPSVELGGGIELHYGQLDMASEATGGSDPDSGFSSAGTTDTEIPPFAGPGLGNYFLKSNTHGTSIRDLDPNLPAFSLIYTDTPADFISGELWDIDGPSADNGEQWLISAVDSMGVEIGSQLSPFGDDGTLNGKPWLFEFTTNVEQIAAIEFYWRGTKTGGTGIAFDNFDSGVPAIEEPPNPVPLPATALLLGPALFGLGVLGRRRQAVRKASAPRA